MTRLLIAALLLFMTALPALGQETSVLKPPATRSVYIAMLYYKLIGQKPDFEAWVESSPAFQNAALHERADMMQSKTAVMREVYDLLTPQEPIVIEIPATISGYSEQQRGFLVTSFNEMTFFNYVYMGQNYAVIPSQISQYLWLKAPPELAAPILRETDNGQNVRMLMTLIPVSADPKPLSMRGRDYHLVMTDISAVEIWAKDGTKTVWDSQFNHPASQQNRLLNLYQ